MLVRQISGMCSVVETWPGELEKSGESCGYISENGVFIRFETERKAEVLESLRRGLFVADCMILAEEGPSLRQTKPLGVWTDPGKKVLL